MHQPTDLGESTLKRSLGPFTLWGLGVGLVISGMYFGWNLGLEKGGTLGFALATGCVTLLYITFTFSYAELACAIPKAGGAFDYARQGLGTHWGFICGVAQVIEFVFAPPAIAAAIGAYFHIYFPAIPTLTIAVVAYLFFTLLNCIGVKLAAQVELVITLLAVAELLLFAGLALPHFRTEQVIRNALPNGYSGAFASLPFAIWFFLAIEGIANVAEETIRPQRTIPIGFGSTLFTLVVLCLLTSIAAVGVGGWEAIVYTTTGEPSDSPLPLALAQITGTSAVFYHLLVGIGLLGLVASFHGILLAAGRATFELGRVGYAPRWLRIIHPRFGTPANALLTNMLSGILILFTGKTGEIITIAVFGALTLYILSMLSLIALRRKAPALVRPFRVPWYPIFPVTALSIASLSFTAMCIYNPVPALLYVLIVGVAYVCFYWFVHLKSRN